MLKISILALHNCFHSSVIGPFDIFSVASLKWQLLRKNEEQFCEVRIVLPDQQSVTACNGLSIASAHTINDTEHFDLIIIPALFGDLEPVLHRPDILEWLVMQHSEGACICTVCAGAFLAASAGLLDGKRATTHWALADDFRRRFPTVILKAEKMLVDEGDIISAGGVTAYLDLCLYLVSRFGSPELASTLTRTLLIDCARQIQSPYSSHTFQRDHGDAAISKSQAWLEVNVTNTVTITQLANVAGLGERTFTRRFKKATGDTPSDYVQLLRIENARKMLETSNDTIESIVQKVGYEDTSSFRRLFKKHTYLSPSAYRKRFSTLLYASADLT
jgi:transcriptional regulator GlxA family with amidase domain